jgi:hypothetical protein
VGVANSRFATPSAAALISETVLAADGQIDIQAIPQTFKHLWIVAMLARAVSANLISDNVNLRLNADAGANYDFESLRDSGGVVAGVGGTGQDRLRWCQAVHVVPLSANERWPVQLWIPYYSRADLFKSIECVAGFRDPTAGVGRVTVNGGQWRSLVAVNRITILGDAAQTDLGAGTRLCLYGLN